MYLNDNWTLVLAGRVVPSRWGHNIIGERSSADRLRQINVFGFLRLCEAAPHAAQDGRHLGEAQLRISLRHVATVAKAEYLERLCFDS
jgi:hypothetical protein